MTTTSKNVDVTDKTSWHNSKAVNNELWIENPGYLLSITPRISEYAGISEDAILQCHVDIAGREGMGFYDCCLTPVGDFTALAYAETLPDRIAVLSYLTEVYNVLDDSKPSGPEEFSIMLPEPNAEKGLQAENTSWKFRSRDVFSKAIRKAMYIDPVLGENILKSLKKWRLSVSHIEERFDSYQSLDDYLEDRRDDVGWGPVLASIKFGANCTPSEEDEASVQEMFAPLYLHGGCVNDYYSWEKEQKAHQEKGSQIINSVALLMRLNNISEADAKARVRNKCLELDRQYSQRKEEYLSAHGCNISPVLRQWIRLVEVAEAGWSLFQMYAGRYHSNGGQWYRDRFEQRTREGRQWFDNCSQSDDILKSG